ncbi:cold-shock protein [Thiotrichales bacterium 19X7-9]|nr:cold-shock protein [Thiotrichales bacterium 19X7-9]TNF65498.1 MAG: cold-shock protein [Gammaproteobacteria bacterium]UTW43077.1 cold-shock protein [bacterium SCSIO 12844]
MATGTVKFFNHEKGFGFIKPEDGSKDLFVHKSNVEGMINDNDQVEYEVTTTQKGPAAVNVRKI